MQCFDPIDTCPYEKVHRVNRSRMQVHLVKCSKQYLKNNPGAENKKKQCPYNTCHIIDDVVFKYHLDTCPDRESVVRYKIDNSCEEERSNFMPIPVNAAINSAENWDDEEVCFTYDPEKVVESKQILRIKPGMSKAERRAFRMSERLRISHLEEQEKLNMGKTLDSTTMSSLDASKSSRNVEKLAKINKELAETDKPLRKPKASNSVTLESLKMSLNDSSLDLPVEVPKISRKTNPKILNDTVNTSLNSTAAGFRSEVTNSTAANSSYSAKIIKRLNETLAAKKNTSNLSVDKITGVMKELNMDEKKENIDEDGFVEVKKHGRNRVVANLQTSD